MNISKQISTLVIMVIPFLSYSQQPMGLTAGAGLYTNIFSENDINSNHILTPFLGLFWILEQSRGISYRPEVLIISKGSNIQSEDTGVKRELKTRTYYIEIPIMMQLSFPINNKTGFYFSVGPHISVGISGNWKNSETPQFGAADNSSGEIKFIQNLTENNASSFDENDLLMRRFELGANARVGLDFDPWTFSLGYSRGLTSTIPKIDGDNTDEASINSGFRLAFSYIIN
ncbi:MAG: porin family protein [Cyclobacteriaceae bacterium]